MKIIGSLGMFFMTIGIAGGIFNRGCIAFGYIGMALTGLYFYMAKGEH